MLPWPASDSFTTHHHTAHAAPSPPPPPPPPNAPHTIPRVHVALHFGSSPIQSTQESPSPHHRHNPPPLLPPSQDHHDQDLREHHIDPIRDSSPFHLDSSQHRSRHVPPLTQLGTASLFQSQTPRRNNSAPPPVLTQQTPTNNSSRVSALSPWRLSGGWSQVGVPPADSHATDKDPDGQAQYSSSPPSRWFPHRKQAPKPVDLHTQAGDHKDHDDFDFDLSDPYAHIPLALTPAPVRALREPLPPPPPPRLASPHLDVPHSQDEDPIVFTPLDPLHSSPTETGDRWTVTSRPAQVHRAPQLPVECQEQSSAPKAPVFYFGTLSEYGFAFHSFSATIPATTGPTTLGFSRVAASLRKSTLASLTSLHTWQLTVHSASRLPSLLYLVHGQLTHAPPNARLAFALPCNVRVLVRAATSVVAHGGQGVSDPMWVKVERAIRAQRGDEVKLKLGEVVGRTLVQGEWVLLARGFALV
ncbi:hypothetical protein BCR44DRAFT_1426748 [Catenaria anguillulae PL171]|uniref:Uncharacterized protein n=1 Tax=Catenaria anguillulae PL171 TaxID=765915 RepID=A0A1Y2HYB6_9FUNG|nr:hypothetical protein BCR44DRAFT_1426748 [Catenaria anguillulae PL171]